MLNEALVAPYEFTTRNLLFPFIESSLGNIPFHTDTPGLTRYVAQKFPIHLAVHKIEAVNDGPVLYTQSHVHDDEDEVNIILSDKTLLYRIELAGEEHYVSSNSSIYIPRGMEHSANVVHGSGYFITLRFQ